jgi:diadenylate cyclase
MAEALAMVAPGQPLRDGLERVLQAKRGALVVVGDGPEVLSICSGGFLLDAEFSPQRLAELAKMDGAIILSPDASRIARANVHLMPDPSIPTTETGTRHRTAERVARSIDVPVISVSAAMSVVTVYRGSAKHVVQPAARVNDRVSQALQTMQRFKQRFDLAVAALSGLEVEDTVTVRDVVAVLQPAELVMRLADEIEGYLLELGGEGRLLRLQLHELVDGVEAVRRLVVRDYLQGGAVPGFAGIAAGDAQGNGSAAQPADHLQKQVMDALRRLSTEELLDVRKVAAILGIPASQLDSDAPIEPRGYRLLHRLPRFPEVVVDRIVEHFAGLQGIMGASVAELEKVGGVGEARARSVKEGLSRLVEASILDRYG